jgi:SAM-dependent methyltransferase
MHKEVRQFIRSVRSKYPQYFFFKKVLECGSLNINGSVRRHFWFCDHFGIDVGPGRCVDMICPAMHFKQPEAYDVVISTEMLEHDKDWKDSLRQMYSNLKPGGLMIITCACVTRPEHGTKRTSPQDSPHTTDYYYNIPLWEFRSVMPDCYFDKHYLTHERGMQDLMFWGIKTTKESYWRVAV